MFTITRSYSARGHLTRAVAVTALLAGICVTTVASPASAEATVATWNELTDAVADPDVANIQLTGDISEAAQALDIPEDRVLVLDLNSHDLAVGNAALGSDADVTITDTGTGDPGTLTASASFGEAGIRTTDAQLTITGGEIVATGGGVAAGIGGDDGDDGGALTIAGGTVEANGGTDGAGIGGGFDGDGGEVSIQDGVVEANGNGWAAGIGGGLLGAGGEVTIEGGVIEAHGGQTSAGIGGGFSGDGPEVTIAGGEVTATGGVFGAGIGGGDEGDGGEVTVTGGTVEAVGGDRGSGIGGGFDGDGGVVTVTGGTVEAEGGSEAGSGIGGGFGGDGGEVTVSDGSVVATGGEFAAGIGGGWDGDGGVVTVTGGTVEAEGGEAGAGIGGGLSIFGGDGGDVVIDGGWVSAAAGSDDASAVGAGFLAPGFGSLSVAGTLVLESPMTVTGSSDDPPVLVGTSGVIEGPGALESASDGLIENHGAVRNETVDPVGSVVVNNFLVTFETPEGPGPDDVRVFAVSFEHGDRVLPDPGTDLAWNTSDDGSGEWVEAETDIGGLVDSSGELNLFAVTAIAPSIGNPDAAAGQVGDPYSHDLEVDGDPEPTVEVVTGELPGGLELNGGLIEGTPDAAGDYQFTVEASNGVEPPAETPVEITISPGEMVPGDPVVEGVPAPGETLSVEVGTWSPEPDDFTYEWLRYGEPIEEQTGPEYTVSMEDSGTELSVRITGERQQYQPATVTSDPVEVPLSELQLFGPDGEQLADGDVLTVGDSVSATGSGWAPGSEVSLILQSDPVHLAAGTVDADGGFELSAVLGETPTGAHRLAVSIDHGEFSHEAGVEVVIESAPEPPRPDPDPSPSPDPGPAGQTPEPEAAGATPPSASTPQQQAQPDSTATDGPLPLTGTNALALAALAMAILGAGVLLSRLTGRRLSAT